MTNSQRKPRSRSKKNLFFVVTTTTGIYKIFNVLQVAVDFYISTLNSLPVDAKIKIILTKFSDKELCNLNLFTDEMFESSSNA